MNKFTLIFALCVAGVYALDDIKIETTKKSPIACTRTAKLGDKVSVQYVLSLENGEEIDTSLDKDKPLTLTLGQGQVIKGFELGILGMCFAEERRVTIPPHLAYGDKVHFSSKLVGFKCLFCGISFVSVFRLSGFGFSTIRFQIFTNFPKLQIFKFSIFVRFNFQFSFVIAGNGTHSAQICVGLWCSTCGN